MLLYHTLIYPYLSYCCIIWGCASSTTLNKLRTLQKRALRLITNSPYWSPSAPIFVKLNLIRLDDIYVFQTAKFLGMFRLNLLPKSCSHFFVISPSIRSHITRFATYFVLSMCRTLIRQNTISIRGPLLWNTVPLNVQSAKTIIEFSNSMYAYLVKGIGNQSCNSLYLILYCCNVNPI